jgi:acid-sensing ion channel, other
VLEFPTVTVCPIDPTDEDKINETAIDFFGMDANNNYDYVELFPFFRIFAGLSYDNLGDADSIYTEALKIDSHIDKKFQKVTFREMAFNLALGCDSFLSQCTYRGVPIQCCENFENLYSEHGFCFSFNPRYIGLPDKE